MSNTEIKVGPGACLKFASSNVYKLIRALMTFPHDTSSLTQHMTASTVVRCIIDVMHCYLPTVILTDKGSQFRSEVVNQIAQRIPHRRGQDTLEQLKNSFELIPFRKPHQIINRRKKTNVAQLRTDSADDLKHKSSRTLRL